MKLPLLVGLVVLAVVLIHLGFSNHVQATWRAIKNG